MPSMDKTVQTFESPVHLKCGFQPTQAESLRTIYRSKADISQLNLPHGTDN